MMDSVSLVEGVEVKLLPLKYADAGHQQAFFNQLFERLDALPGVVAAGGNSFLPLTGLGAATSFLAAHDSPQPLPPEQDFIQMEVYGRGNNAYRWAGEVEL